MDTSDKILASHVFIQFLTHHDCLNLWLVNVILGRSERQLETLVHGMYRNTSDLISGAFSWSGTPEGSIYWSNISSEWEDIHYRIEEEFT